MSVDEVATAFLVVVPGNGTPCSVVTKVDIGAPIDHEATGLDVRRACQDIVNDLLAQAVAGYLQAAGAPTSAERVAAALKSREP